MTTTKALLWSKQQNCFHIEPMDRLLRTNLRAFVNDSALSDYHLIASGTDEEVRQIADRLRPEINKRDKARIQITHHQPT